MSWRGAAIRNSQENAMYMSWLAEDYMQLGDIGQAAEIATRMAALTSHTELCAN